GELLVAVDAGGDPRVALQVVAAEGIRSVMAVPLTVAGAVQGVFVVAYCRPHPLGAEHRRLLRGLAERAGLALENARLYQEARARAALEERQRLARELHDAVTQTLFSASLIAEVLPRIWARDAEQGLARLEELHQLTRGALAEMRTLLLELRPSTL